MFYDPNGGGETVIVDVGLERLAEYGDLCSLETHSILFHARTKTSNEVRRYRIVEFPSRQHEVGERQLLDEEIAIFGKTGSAGGPGKWDRCPFVTISKNADDVMGIFAVVLGDERVLVGKGEVDISAATAPTAIQRQRRWTISMMSWRSMLLKLARVSGVAMQRLSWSLGGGQRDDRAVRA